MILRPTLLRSALAGGVAALGLACAAVAHAQAPAAAPAPVTLSVKPIVPGKLYWVAGGGGNSGILIGDKGVVVIDAKTTPEAGRALVAEVAKLTPKPITHVIVTHSDGDHFNGLAGFPEGLKIVAHENNKAELMATYLYAAVEVGGGRCLPPRDRLPNVIVRKDRVDTVIDGEPIRLLHFAPAHTNGDLVVYLPRQKTAFTGDLITSTVLVHPEKNGSLDGWFASARGLLALDADRYVGGHANELDTKASLAKQVADRQAMRDRVDAMVDQGKTLAEVKTALGDPAKDPSGCRGVPFPSYGEAAFHARTNRNQELK